MTNFWQAQRFDSIEALQEGFQKSDVEAVQLKPGALSGTSILARLGKTQLRARSFRGAARVRGVLSKQGHCFGVVLDAEGKSSQWSFKRRSGDIAVLPCGADHEGRYDGTTSFVVLEISKEALVEASAKLLLRLPETFWDNPLMHRPPGSFAQLIVRRFRTAVKEIVERPQMLNDENATYALHEELLGLMIQGCASSVNRPIGRNQTFISSSRVVRDTENYLKEHLHENVCARALCVHLGISNRNLHRAFCDVLDVPPGVYMRRWRLSRVRCLLSSPELADQSVSDVAFNFGFWELGRFAGHYRQLFGELPSQTLKRAVSAEGIKMAAASTMLQPSAMVARI